MKLDSPEAIAKIKARLVLSRKVQAILARESEQATKKSGKPAKKRYASKSNLHKIARLGVELQDLLPDLYAKNLLSKTEQRRRKRNASR